MPLAPLPEVALAALFLVGSARSAGGVHVAPRPVNCPKVYVYELPSEISFISDRSLSEELILGERLIAEPHVRGTNQYLLTEIVYYRLLRSACRTLDPDDADLFFMPILAGMNIGPNGWPSLQEEAVVPPSAATSLLQRPRRRGRKNAPEPANGSSLVLSRSARYDNQCRWLAEHHPNLTTYLPHLNSRTAHMHFMLMPNEHFTYKECTGWFSHPRGHFARAMRVTTTRLLPPELREELAYMECCSEEFFTERAYPHLFSASYPSAVHWSDDGTPWDPAAPRTRLLLFIGDDGHGDVEVRRKITEQCNSYNDPSICQSTKFSLDKLALKRESVFCLEPGGDSPSRRSIADSISFGCIPVLFSSSADYLYELNWLGWRELSRILVPRSDFIAGDIDLKDLFQSMPQHDIRQMQRALAANARKFQYSLHDDDGDGVSSLLHGLKASADIAGASPRRY